MDLASLLFWPNGAIPLQLSVDDRYSHQDWQCHRQPVWWIGTAFDTSLLAARRYFVRWIPRPRSVTSLLLDDQETPPWLHRHRLPRERAGQAEHPRTGKITFSPAGVTVSACKVRYLLAAASALSCSLLFFSLRIASISNLMESHLDLSLSLSHSGPSCVKSFPSCVQPNFLAVLLYLS